jgi:hypothetical protein
MDPVPDAIAPCKIFSNPYILPHVMDSVEFIILIIFRLLHARELDSLAEAFCSSYGVMLFNFVNWLRASSRTFLILGIRVLCFLMIE